MINHDAAVKVTELCDTTISLLHTIKSAMNDELTTTHRRVLTVEEADTAKHLIAFMQMLFSAFTEVTYPKS